MELSEGDLVFCTVRKIEGTTVFLEIEGNGVGTMVFSEVLAGRIRNLREHVSLGKKIVCKVLKISKEHVELSLRRVTGKEKERVLKGHKKERMLRNVLKAVVGEQDAIIEKIKREHDILDFLDEVQENPLIFENYLSKDDAKKVVEIISEKEKSEKKVVKEIRLKSDAGNGVDEIKEVLDFSDEDIEIRYLGSSKFSVRVRAREFKEAGGKMEEILEEIGKRAKAKKMFFEVRKEK